MSHFESAVLELDALNQTLLLRKRARGAILPEEFAQVRELVRKIHAASLNEEVPEIGRVLEEHDLGFGVRFLEPNYSKLNEAFAWIEAKNGEGDDDD